MQDIDAAPLGLAGIDHLFHRGLARDVRLEAHGVAAALGFLLCHLDGLFRGSDVLVGAENLRALLHEADDRRPPVAHAGARPLPGSHYDRDLVLQPHGVRPNLLFCRHDLNNRSRRGRTGF
jgi:hypothetical protein